MTAAIRMALLRRVRQQGVSERDGSGAARLRVWQNGQCSVRDDPRLWLEEVKRLVPTK